MKKSNSSLNSGESENSKLCSKFDDATSLENAYLNLERDYTKKCQELASYKKLEKRIVEEKKIERLADVLNEAITEKTLENLTQIRPCENVDEAKTDENLKNITQIRPDENIVDEAKSDENLENITQIRPDENKSLYMLPGWNERVIEFFNKNPDAEDYRYEIATILDGDDGLSKLSNGLDIAYKLARTKDLKKASEVIGDEEFIKENILNSPSFRDLVFKQFAEESIKKNASVPKISSSNSSGTIVSPRKKISSFDDAREVLLSSLLKNDNDF